MALTGLLGNEALSTAQQVDSAATTGNTMKNMLLQGRANRKNQDITTANAINASYTDSWIKEENKSRELTRQITY